MTSVREPAMAALFALVSAAYSFAKNERRLKLWTDVPVGERPALFQFEGGVDGYAWSNDLLPKRTIEAKLFIYFDAKDPSVVGASQINDVLDAIDAALTPTGRDAHLGRQTLGGTAFNCRIDGQVFKDPGDLDGDGLAIIPIKIILP